MRVTWQPRLTLRVRPVLVVSFTAKLLRQASAGDAVVVCMRSLYKLDSSSERFSYGSV
jgi:hypothetical protein